MDITQAVLLSVLVVLTIFLVFIGFQAFFALRDLRRTLKKVDQLVDDTDQIAKEVKGPVSGASHFLTTLTTGAGIALLLKKARRDKET